MDKTAIDTLLESAILAPSGDNTQPWRFTVDRAAWKITIDVDPTRDPSPMNAGQRMAWIAIGAAIENMVRTADRNGWRHELTDADGHGPATFRLVHPAEAGTIDRLIRDRVTNRRVYERGEILPECMERLKEATGVLEGVQAHWITDSKVLDSLSEMIARADALILGTKPIRDAFLDKVRFDQPATAVVDEGLSLGSLEVSGFEQTMLRVMRYMPDGVLRAMGGRRVFAGVTRRLAKSASGICIISTPDDSLASRIPVGRLWQRAWLALTEQGLAAQPMMSIAVIRNIRDYGENYVLDSIGRSNAQAILDEAEVLSNLTRCEKIDAVMRFGSAKSVTAKTGRLPV